MSQENVNDNVKAVQDVLENIVKTEQGKKYVYGSNDSTKSFDCSSLVQYVNGKIGIILPRTAREQAKIGQTIETNFDEKKLKKGDRLYFKNDPKQPEIVTHTAIYLGNGKIIHASSRREKVVIEKIADRNDLFKKGNFACAKRDINNKTASKIISRTLTPILHKLKITPFKPYSSKENKINLNNVNKTKSKTNKNNFTQNKKITIESTNLNKNFNSKNITSSIKTNSNNKKTDFKNKNITQTIKTNSKNKNLITKSITKKEYETKKYKINI